MAKTAVKNLKTYRVPLVGTFQNRSGSLSKDQRFINCFPESRKNDITDTKKIYLVKRGGLDLFKTLSGEGRGVWYWNSHTYSVFGNTLYSDTTALQTLTTSSGMCAFTEATTVTQDVLVLADGEFVYVIDKNNNVKQVPLSPATWAASTTYVVDDIRIPTTSNGFYYKVTIAGTSSGSAPTWPTYIGQQVTDGGVTWECAGYSNSLGSWSSSTSYVLGQRIKQSNGVQDYMFEVTTAGTSGSSTPTWYFTPGYYTTDNTAQWVCIGPYRTDAPPAKHQPSIAFLDGYVFLILKKTDGSKSADIYNSDLDNPYSWNSTNYITAEQFPDAATALARQNNLLIAFGETSTEFFYDNANQMDSPLARNTSYTLQVGIAAPNALYQNERFCIFVGQSQSGGRAVWMLDGVNPKKISDEYIERMLDAEGTNITTATGYGIRTNGHLFFVLNLATKTVVYDLEEKLWHEWQGVDCVAMTDDSTGQAILQHKSNGKLYHLNPNIGVDDGVQFNTEIYTTKLDFETMNRKNMQSLNIVTDLLGTSEVISVRWSDDDYQSWSSWYDLGCSSRTYKPRLGAFRRRAFNIKYTGSFPIRFESVEFDIILWNA